MGGVPAQDAAGLAVRSTAVVTAAGVAVDNVHRLPVSSGMSVYLPGNANGIAEFSAVSGFAYAADTTSYMDYALTGTAAGNTFTYQFYGERLGVLAQLGSDRGRLAVVVDGGSLALAGTGSGAQKNLSAPATVGMAPPTRNTAGVADPAAAPSVSAVSAASTLVYGTYNVAYSFVTASGETTVSPTASVTIGSGQVIQVAAITPPAGATVNYYITAPVIVDTYAAATMPNQHRLVTTTLPAVDSTGTPKLHTAVFTIDVTTNGSGNKVVIQGISMEDAYNPLAKTSSANVINTASQNVAQVAGVAIPTSRPVTATASVPVVLNSESMAATSYELLTTIGGKSYAVVDTTAGATVKSGAGRLCQIAITAAGSGTGNFIIKDGNTVVYRLPNNTTVGTVVELSIPVTTSIVVPVATNGPTIVVTYY